MRLGMRRAKEHAKRDERCKIIVLEDSAGPSWDDPTLVVIRPRSFEELRLSWLRLIVFCIFPR